MASIFFKRLEKKYGKKNISGKKYQKMISEILSNNKEKIGNATARLTKESYDLGKKRLSAKNQKIIKLPDIGDVLPKRSVFLIKGAEQGKIISTNLRTELESSLRNTIKQFTGTGKNKMEIQRGRTTGKINPELIKVLQERLSEKFESSTKRDKGTGVPPNIRNIAVTEARTTIQMIKKEYVKNLLEKNPQIKMTKTWIHNKSLSKNPRKTHMQMEGVTIPINQLFKVAREKDSGYDYMDGPHDPNAPPEQVIGCSCDQINRASMQK